MIVHDHGRDGSAVTAGCHFLIGRGERFADGEIHATGLWRRQQEGRHIRVPGHGFNADSIGVCLLADCRQAPQRAGSSRPFSIWSGPSRSPVRSRETMCTYIGNWAKRGVRGVISPPGPSARG